jgi:cell division protein FtsQ
MARKNRRKATKEQKRDKRSRRLRVFVRFPIRLFALLVVGGGIGVAGYYLVDYLRTSPALAVRSIEVHGIQRTDKAKLLRAAGLEEGMNIFAIEVKQVERKIEALSWIDTADVVRAVPDRISVEVQEHQPVAIISLESPYYVNNKGEVFKRVQPGESVDLPVLTGISRNEFQTDNQNVKAAILQAMQLVGWTKQISCLGDLSVAEINLDELIGASLVLDPGALTVHLGKKDVRKRLNSICRVLQEVKERKLQAHSIMLDHVDQPGRTTVRLDGWPPVLR